MHVYVVYEEYDYEGHGAPAGAYSTYEKAYAAACKLIPKHKLAADEADGSWLLYQPNSSYSVHISKFEVDFN